MNTLLGSKYMCEGVSPFVDVPASIIAADKTDSPNNGVITYSVDGGHASMDDAQNSRRKACA